MSWEREYKKPIVCILAIKIIDKHLSCELALTQSLLQRRWYSLLNCARRKRLINAHVRSPLYHVHSAHQASFPWKQCQLLQCSLVEPFRAHKRAPCKDLNRARWIKGEKKKNEEGEWEVGFSRWKNNWFYRASFALLIFWNTGPKEQRQEVPSISRGTLANGKDLHFWPTTNCTWPVKKINAATTKLE